jgi:hypothetical protein
MSDIERELEFELHRVLDPVASTPIPARRTARPAGPVKTLLGGAGAALTIKVLTGVAVAAAAVTVAGAATTHSLNPSVWGQQVKQQVETCKDQLAQQDHGIGDCVSGFANQHGQTVASDARQHGNGNGNGNGNGSTKDKQNNGNGNGNGKSDTGKDKPKDSPGAEPAEPTDPSSHATARVSPGP